VIDARSEPEFSLAINIQLNKLWRHNETVLAHEFNFR